MYRLKNLGVEPATFLCMYISKRLHYVWRPVATLPPPVSTPSQPSVAIPSVTHPLVGNGTLLPAHPVENALRSVSTSLYHLCHTPPPPLFSVRGYVGSYNDSVTPTSQTRSLAFSSFLFRLIFFVPPLFRVCGNEDRRKGWL